MPSWSCEGRASLSIAAQGRFHRYYLASNGVVPVEAALCRDRPPCGLEAITLSESTNVPLASL